LGIQSDAKFGVKFNGRKHGEAVRERPQICFAICSPNLVAIFAAIKEAMAILKAIASLILSMGSKSIRHPDLGRIPHKPREDPNMLPRELNDVRCRSESSGGKLMVCALFSSQS
jgi:hypothetical protein